MPQGMGEVRMQAGRKTGELVRLRFREKLIKECVVCPYRKPTQVSWWRTPRHSGKCGLRNSAKKLSVSSARCSVPIYRDYNKSLSTDCLAKTQAPANPERGRIGADTCPVLVSQPLGLIFSTKEERLGSDVSSSERQL